MMLIIGYSTFMTLVIRSNANPTIDENSPEDAVALGRKIRQVLGLNICGIDLLFGKDGFMVGEVNSLPGFPTGEEYDGEPVGKRYHRMLMEYMMKIKD